MQAKKTQSDKIRARIDPIRMVDRANRVPPTAVPQPSSEL
jgi:hypothetical protein